MIVGVNQPGAKFATHYRAEKGLLRALRVAAALREPRPILILRRADDLGAWSPASRPLLRRGFRIAEVQGARYLCTVQAIPGAEALEDRVAEALGGIGRFGSATFPTQIADAALGFGLLFDVLTELGSTTGHRFEDYSDASAALVAAVAGKRGEVEYSPTPPTWRRPVAAPW